MVNTELIRTVVGIIGNIISFGLFTSPIPTFMRIIKKKDVEEFSPIPYIACVMNCMLWIFYGLPFVHPDSTLFVTINSIGLEMELIYLTLFLFYGNNGHRKKICLFIAVELCLVAILVAVTLTQFHTYVTRSKFVGIFSVICGILMYGAPLTKMLDVIKTESVEFMPFWLSVAGFSNALIWLVYALLKFDLFILIANGTGAVLGAIQLILYANIYYRTTRKKGNAAGGKSSEVQLQSPVLHRKIS